MILASIGVPGPAITLAQAQENAKIENKEIEGQDREKANVVTGERPMISTGLDSETIAKNWPDAAVWLESPGEERVLALFEPESALPAKGALLILADEGQSPVSGLAGALREPLSRQGWAVMTLGLEPLPYEVRLSRRQREEAASEEAGVSEPEAAGEADGGASDSESVMIDVMDGVDVKELTDKYLTRIQKYLMVATGNLVDRGYNRVVVAGIGRAAGHVSRLVTTAEGSNVSALIWIAPEFDRGESEALAEWLTSAGSPRILELHSSRRSEESDRVGARSPQQREAALNRAEVTGYFRQPVAMARQPGPRKAPALANRISAWLESER